MMFTNIIYFIFVLLIFNMDVPREAPEVSLPVGLGLLAVIWIAFAGYCGYSFRALGRRLSNSSIAESRMAGRYQRVTMKLSVLAVLQFAAAVYFLDLKYWLQQVPGFQHFSVLQGTAALALFFGYLATIWYLGHPVYRAAFNVSISRRSYLNSNLRLNVPILFPWFFLSLLYDLLAMSPLSDPGGVMETLGGQVLFFATFLVLLLVVMPGMIQYWWGCEPLNGSEKARELQSFLEQENFRCRRLLRWPIFEGKMLTAGIMGLIPRYRYIMITDSLMKALTTEELKAVVAHEMGHARYRHLLFYIIFFVGFMVLSFGLYDILLLVAVASPGLTEVLSGSDARAGTLSYVITAVPMLVVLLIYFRYVMGFFMRNFERQADLYSAAVMGGPRHTVSALEKIAVMGGKIRDLPSWHHFSIRERVDFLWRAMRRPDLRRQHHRYLGLCFGGYLIGLVALGYFLNFSAVKTDMTYTIAEKALKRQVAENPADLDAYVNLAMVYQQREKYGDAIGLYEEILSRDADHSVALNNLAWLLVAEGDDTMRDPQRALELARRAVSLNQTPEFLDTLAEAYFVNGMREEAVQAGKKALGLARTNLDYYRDQLERFRMSGSER